MRFALFLFLVIGHAGFGQSLSNLNLNYWYDPNTEFEFVMTPVSSGNEMMVYYQLIVNRKENVVDTYSIAWESRSNLNDKTGQAIEPKDSVVSKSTSFLSGVITVPSTTDLWYITAKITNTPSQESFYYYKLIDPQWPANSLFMANGAPWLKTYVASGSSVSLAASSRKKIYGFYYKTSFTPARPPYAELISTDPFLKADSTFTVSDSFVPFANGLYLFQEDTSSNQGFAFVVADKSYPKYNKITSLVGPLVYICTDDEYKQLQAAQSEKAAFDKVILDITKDKERARDLMRSYFQRVETANRFFTDYKEGWRTDRGMIYIIYGLPEEVSRTADKEIWNYKANKTKFVFNKTKSIFSPESYKLQRENGYMMRWFSLIDLWRKSRF
jgi:GWxTD domain-containing protein